MTTYRKSMREALNQVYLGEDNMALLKKAAGGAAQKLKMKDGKVTMDSFTASAIMQVYKAINPKNKKTMENVVNTGTISALQKLQALAMRAIKSGDEVEHDGEELDEAKYDLYHKDFSSAMQHSYKMAKKMYGITVDPKEIDDKVASGPRKPTEGKTNSYRLKGDKGAIQVQVYNKGGSKPFELNMYKEEVELDEVVKVGDTVKVKLNRKGKEYIEKGKVTKIEKDSIIVKHDFSRTPSRVSMKNIVKEEVELDEVAARGKKYDDSKIGVGTPVEVKDKSGKAHKGRVVKVNRKDDKVSVSIDAFKGRMVTLSRNSPQISIVREEVELDESKKALKAKSEKSGVSVGILSKVYDRGMAAYKTGHRPGTTPQQWALARVNSFLTGGGARKADADLWKQAKGQKEEVDLGEGTILVADPKTQKVIKIDEKDWPKYEKKGYVQAEGNELGEATKWKMGDGRPRGGAYIENERFWDLDRDALLYIMKDADAAMKANPTGRKAGKYADEVNDAHTVLGWRKKNGIKEEVELDEASARADAKRAMRKDRGVDPADVDSSATDDDVKAASKNIIMQLRKSVSLRGNFPVEFMDKKKVKVDAKIAAAVQDKYNSMKKASDKEKFQVKIAKSYKDMLSALKEGFASDAQRRAAFASGYKEKGKKKKEDAILDRVGKKLKERKNG